MPLRLIDPNHTTPIEVSGVTFHVKQLSAIQKSKVAFLLEDKNLVAGDLEAATRIIAASVVDYQPRIMAGETELSATEVMLRMDDPADYWNLLTAMLKISTLSENDRKNSGSSSAGGESSKQAGQDTTITAGAQEDV